MRNLKDLKGDLAQQATWKGLYQIVHKSFSICTSDTLRRAKLRVSEFLSTYLEYEQRASRRPPYGRTIAASLLPSSHIPALLYVFAVVRPNSLQSAFFASLSMTLV